MAKNKVLLRVKDVKKSFQLPQNRTTSLKTAFVNVFHKDKKVTQRVLEGITFDVNQGDFLGIVGRNGSGKSTLLKIIAGVYQPTKGSVEIRGKLTPFIELGVGFNPELSGRDNVYLNGALLGFSRAQMDDMYANIVGFAELEDFMDQKLKNYSSGMQVRLAFSIAIMAKNEILIFDEVLAVGDEAFQRKCLDVFEEYKASGQTVILVTHDMETVKNFCTRAVLISEGKIEKAGNPIEVADEYTRINQVIIDDEVSKRNISKDDLQLVLRSITTGKAQTSVAVAGDILFDLTWHSDIPAEVVMFDIYKRSGEHITTFKSNTDRTESFSGKTQAKVVVNMPLQPGKYYVQVSLRVEENDKALLTNYKAAEFIVADDWGLVEHAWSGLVGLPHTWVG